MPLKPAQRLAVEKPIFFNSTEMWRYIAFTTLNDSRCTLCERLEAREIIMPDVGQSTEYFIHLDA